MNFTCKYHLVLRTLWGIVSIRFIRVPLVMFA